MKKKAWFYLLSIYSYQDICIVWFNNYLYVVLKWIIFIKKSEICLMCFLVSVVIVYVSDWEGEKKVCVLALSQRHKRALPYKHLYIHCACVCSFRFQHCTLITALPLSTVQCIAQHCFCWKAVAHYLQWIHLQCRKHSGCCKSH